MSSSSGFLIDNQRLTHHQSIIKAHTYMMISRCSFNEQMEVLLQVRLDLGLTSPQAQWLAKGGSGLSSGNLQGITENLADAGGIASFPDSPYKHRRAPWRPTLPCQVSCCQLSGLRSVCILMLLHSDLLPSFEPGMRTAQGLCAGGPGHMARAVPVGDAAGVRAAAGARRHAGCPGVSAALGPCRGSRAGHPGRRLAGGALAPDLHAH